MLRLPWRKERHLVLDVEAAEAPAALEGEVPALRLDVGDAPALAGDDVLEQAQGVAAVAVRAGGPGRRRIRRAPSFGSARQ